ncbi:WYL domain-containing protein [Cetobacterium ceti]|uniref:WYL domain-containing protein n=1 Tax=Cetobacterium ceti TaxID=180163 RepID=A0A1T4K6D9_9FUSO|nr:WYL domain-containing protein [Cetobacterium ceti]SJZ37986.1 WYL domain-containing protein [Cetobacterium ceti]
MEKKLRVTLPKHIGEIIESDTEEFKVTKNFLFNYIFENLKNEKLIEDYDKDGEKTVVQFNLNKKNRENYYDFLEEKNIQIEANFFRRLFMKYGNFSKKKRERFIFKGIVERVEIGIEEKRNIKITFMDGKEKKVEPYYIGSSELEIANYIFSYDLDSEKFKNYRLNNIKSVYVTREKFKEREKAFIEKVKNNFDPFLSEGKKIKVKLSETGQKMFRDLKVNRPKVIKKDKDVYELQCSEEKAKRYFTYFLDEVEILEPLVLREWFKEKYKKAVEVYN